MGHSNPTLRLLAVCICGCILMKLFHFVNVLQQGKYLSGSLVSCQNLGYYGTTDFNREDAYSMANFVNVQHNTPTRVRRLVNPVYTWKARLLAEKEPVKVFSNYFRQAEDHEACTRHRTKDKFTIILNTFGHFCPPAANYQLIHSLNHYIEGLHELVDRIIISWNPTSNGNAYGVVSLLKYIRNRVPVEIVLHNANKLDNRFKFGNYSCSDSILHLDNDILIKAEILKVAFSLFKEHFHNRILGFYCATYVIQRSRPLRVLYRSWSFRSQKPNHDCNFILTGLAFLHVKYHYEYFSEKYLMARSVVDRLFTGEDLLMNFVVAGTIPKRKRKIQIRPTSTGSFVPFGHAIHFDHRDCFAKMDVNMKFGHHVRYGKTLWNNGKTPKLRSAVIEFLLDQYGEIVSIDSIHSSLCILDSHEVKYVSRIEAISFAEFNTVYDSKDSPYFHIIIPYGENADSSELSRAVNSVLIQGYEKKTIWIVSDGNRADKYLSRLCLSIPIEGIIQIASVYINSSATHIFCMKTNKLGHLGSAYSKYLGFHSITSAHQFHEDDIILILDGDDFLIGNATLSYIKREYEERNCWCSWGGMKGLYSEQAGPLKSSALNVRQQEWKFVHPRTMKVGIAARFREQDFQDREKQWLHKATDTGFIYRMIELAGNDHACFLEEKLYQYTTKGVPLSSLAVSKNRKQEILDYLKSMEPSIPIKTLKYY